MSENVPQPDIVLRFYGTSEVTVYRAGLAVVHTSLTPENTVERIISVRGGPVVMNTTPPLDILAIAGPCTVAIEGGPSVILNAGANLMVPQGATFTLEGAAAILKATTLFGPNFVPRFPPGGNP